MKNRIWKTPNHDCSKWKVISVHKSKSTIASDMKLGFGGVAGVDEVLELFVGDVVMVLDENGNPVAKLTVEKSRLIEM